jgi:5-methylcytosine-specific restriction endonuclease McrA
MVSMLWIRKMFNTWSYFKTTREKIWKWNDLLCKYGSLLTAEVSICLYCHNRLINLDKMPSNSGRNVSL